jgi:hypothetical protein
MTRFHSSSEFLVNFQREVGKVALENFRRKVGLNIFFLGNFSNRDIIPDTLQGIAMKSAPALGTV